MITPSPLTIDDVDIIHREILYQGMFTLLRYRLKFKLYNGHWSDEVTREVLERKSSVAVLPYDPKTDSVVLIEQFRSGIVSNASEPWLTEIVAGIIDTPDELPNEVATREAQEEAGCMVEDLQLIQKLYVSPGGCNEEISIFCGKTDASSIDGIYGLEDEQENIRAFTLPVDEAFNKLHNHEIKTAPAVIALQWLELNRTRLRAMWQK